MLILNLKSEKKNQTADLFLIFDVALGGNILRCMRNKFGGASKTRELE